MLKNFRVAQTHPFAMCIYAFRPIGNTENTFKCYIYLKLFTLTSVGIGKYTNFKLFTNFYVIWILRK